jgi:hypothetical protein
VWIKQFRPSQLSLKGQFSESGKRNCPIAGFLKVAGIRETFCSGGLIPTCFASTNFDAMIFLLLWWIASMKLPRIPTTFKNPAKKSWTSSVLQTQKIGPSSRVGLAETVQNPWKFPAKNGVENLL